MDSGNMEPGNQMNENQLRIRPLLRRTLGPPLLNYGTTVRPCPWLFIGITQEGRSTGESNERYLEMGTDHVDCCDIILFGGAKISVPSAKHGGD